LNELAIQKPIRTTKQSDAALENHSETEPACAKEKFQAHNIRFQAGSITTETIAAQKRSQKLTNTDLKSNQYQNNQKGKRKRVKFKNGQISRARKHIALGKGN
jgi:hypothetical protein